MYGSELEPEDDTAQEEEDSAVQTPGRSVPPQTTKKPDTPLGDAGQDKNIPAPTAPPRDTSQGNNVELLAPQGTPPTPLPKPVSAAPIGLSQ